MRKARKGLSTAQINDRVCFLGALVIVFFAGAFTGWMEHGNAYEDKECPILTPRMLEGQIWFVYDKQLNEGPQEPTEVE